MSDNKDVYLSYIKNDIAVNLDSGLIADPSAQYKYIENICKDLLLLNKSSITGMVEKYFNSQRSLQVKIEAKNKELMGLFDDYAENAKVMIEEIKKLD